MNRMMLYEMQSDDGARHQTTRCLCRAVRQFFDQMTTLSLEGWLRVLRYGNRMLSDRRCIGFMGPSRLLHVMAKCSAGQKGVVVAARL